MRPILQTPHNFLRSLTKHRKDAPLWCSPRNATNFGAVIFLHTRQHSFRSLRKPECLAWIWMAAKSAKALPSRFCNSAPIMEAEPRQICKFVFAESRMLAEHLCSFQKTEGYLVPSPSPIL